MRPAEFIRFKQTKICLCAEGLCTSQACKGKMSPVLEPHYSVCSRFCPEPALIRLELSGVVGMGLEDLP